MSKLKYLLVLSLSIITVFISCEKDEENDKIDPSDSLEQHGILGKWRLQALTISGITDMSIRFDTLEFTGDSELDDLKGEFTRTHVGNDINGIFELDTVNSIIHFDINNTQKSFLGAVSDNS
ncbi:hypothetical protein [Maribacter sp. IgM3_T14_3]|uniref:hypothetical protein n=1 Tax=Maribacter sp. IgM3_T14_3 TaxID=3415140 RepID=UPI003C6F3AD1